MSSYIFAVIGAGALIALAGTPAAHAGGYTYIAVPPPRYAIGPYYVAGINDSGAFVGSGFDTNFNSAAFAWNNGAYSRSSTMALAWVSGSAPSTTQV
jgi:hypothetical protein